MLAAMLLASSAGASEVVIDLLPEAAAANDYVRLGEVARITGENSAPLSRIFLGPAPAAGEIIAISREEISRCLNETGHHEFTMRGAALVKVSRTTVDVVSAVSPASASGGGQSLAGRTAALPAAAPPTKTGSAEEALVTAAIARLLSRQFRRDDLEGEAHLLSLDRALPSETAALEAREVVSGRLPGRAEVRLLAVDKADRPLGFVLAKVEAWASAPALMLVRSLRKGEAVEPADLLIAHARLQPGVVYLPARPEAVIGCQATRPLRPEIPLAEGDLEIPWSVRKGDLVAVDTMAGGFRVRSVAKALANGRVGAAIAVENPDTRKIYLARVIDMGRVEVMQDKER